MSICFCEPLKMPFRQTYATDNDLKKALRLTMKGINPSSSRGHNLQESTIFPMALWKTLGNRNLLRDFTPDPYAPCDNTAASLPHKNIALSGFIITRYYFTPGLTMAWLGQLLKTHFLHSLNYHDSNYIEAIRCGKSLCALAISEPNIGAHPKHLTCSATKHGQLYILNGEKAFVSHGPYADRLIVLAITDEKKGRKYYSAFLVPVTNEGIKLIPTQPVSGLRPTSHCNIVFTDCLIPADYLIGTPGRAFEEISLPMRTLEDSLMLAPIAGAIYAQLDHIAQTCTSGNEKQPARTAANHSTIDRKKLGQLLCIAESAKELSIIAANKLDQQTSTSGLTALIIGFRSLVKQVQTSLLEWHDEYPGLRPHANDIQILTNIGQQATSARADALAERFLTQRAPKN